MHTHQTDNLRASIAPSEQIQVAAIFENKSKAQQTVEKLTSKTEIDAQQVAFIDASDKQVSEKLEEESDAIGKRMWHSHLAMGSVGILMGLIFAFLLVNYGPDLTQRNPLFTYIALISPGLFTGLFIAGLVGLRPDRSEIIQTVRHAIRRNEVAVVINLKKQQSVSKVSSFLNAYSNTVVEAIQ